MSKQAAHICLFLIAAMTLFSCEKQQQRMLQSALDIYAIEPDSALHLLNTIEESLLDTRDRATFALVYTIGDLYLYLIREDINIPEGHMSGADRTFNDENESLSSFFDLCVYQYQTVILSVWQNQVVGQYYPKSMYMFLNNFLCRIG